MKKIIYFCKHGEAVSDWNIASEVDWICSLTVDKVKQINLNGINNYAVHLNSYVQCCNCCNVIPIVNTSNIDKDYIDVDKLPFIYSTHLIIDEIRARIAEGVLNKDDVKIYVENSNGDMQLKIIDANGGSDIWFDTEYIVDDIYARLFKI